MLILGAKEKPSIGDAAAFERAVSPLLPTLRSYCRSVARNRWDADDLLQDTLMKAFLRFVQTGGAPMNRAYVCRIASNAWIDRARRAREDVRPAEWRGWETLARAADDGGTDDVRAAVERLVAALTPKQRTALLLCEAFGLSLQETGERLGLPAGAVKSLLHRARAALRRADGEPADALDGGVVDAYVHALRLGLTQAVVALGAEPAPLDLLAGAEDEIDRLFS